VAEGHQPSVGARCIGPEGPIPLLFGVHLNWTLKLCANGQFCAQSFRLFGLYSLLGRSSTIWRVWNFAPVGKKMRLLLWIVLNVHFWDQFICRPNSSDTSSRYIIEKNLKLNQTFLWQFSPAFQWKYISPGQSSLEAAENNSDAEGCSLHNLVPVAVVTTSRKDNNRRRL
jgi:hypothetical protein